MSQGVERIEKALYAIAAAGTTKYVKGDTSGAVVPSGNVGEVITSLVGGGSFSAASTWQIFGSYTLPAGKWLVFANYTVAGGTTGFTRVAFGVSPTPGSGVGGALDVTATPFQALSAGPGYFNTSTSQTIYLNGYCGGYSSPPTLTAFLTAIRIT